MGLFDGVPAGAGRTGAAADLARRYGIPVLLVLDVSGQSQTAAAIARGFATHDPGVRDRRRGAEPGRERPPRAAGARRGRGDRRAGGRRGAPQPRHGAARAPPRAGAGARARRARGLHRAPRRRHGALARPRRDAGARRAARPARRRRTRAALPPPGQRIAVAEDAAFSFLYPHVARHWRAAGAELVPFSPLADEAPADGLRRLLAAGRLPRAARRRARRRGGASAPGSPRFAETRPVHGECGGFMVLGRALEDADGATHPMAGLLGHVTSFARRAHEPRLPPGAAARGRARSGGPARRVRGHEFHYARLIEPGRDAPLAEMSGRPRPPARRLRRPARPRHRHLLPRHRPGLSGMRRFLVIGIGTGNPEHVTVQAIGALNRADAGADPAQGRGQGRPGRAPPRDLPRATSPTPPPASSSSTCRLRDAGGALPRGASTPGTRRSPRPTAASPLATAPGRGDRAPGLGRPVALRQHAAHPRAAARASPASRSR